MPPVQQETWKAFEDDYDSDVPFDELVRRRPQSNEQRKNKSNANHNAADYTTRGREPSQRNVSAQKTHRLADTSGLNGHHTNPRSSQNNNTKHHAYRSRQDPHDEDSSSSGSEVMDDLRNLSSFLKERRLRRKEEEARKEARNGRSMSRGRDGRGMKDISNTSSLRTAQYERRSRR
mmetsp:Transcript_1725/g.2375  ORF Transcript_1725/g.2375 Transcript_1725/m.2375 type:complete len:176 (+) Transcript_1725:111-638(+)